MKKPGDVEMLIFLRQESQLDDFGSVTLSQPVHRVDFEGGNRRKVY